MSHGTTTAVTRLTPKAQRGRMAKAGRLACFHCASGPIPIQKMAGVSRGRKTVSKYGGPTEILPRSNASKNKGYKVPRSTDPKAATSNTLFASSIPSREIMAKPPPSPPRGARPAYNTKEPPTTTAKNTRMNKPRFGSVANACTEVKTPERTKKVPSRLSENAMMASSTLHASQLPRLSVTASECINAVPASHGMKEAFSTGSQNHQPPQPSS